MILHFPLGAVYMASNFQTFSRVTKFKNQSADINELGISTDGLSHLRHTRCNVVILRQRAHAQATRT